MFKKIISGILLSASFFALSGCEEGGDRAGQTPSKTYQIGVITSLTGPTAASGQQQKNILDFHVAELNKKNPFKVELVYQDGQCDAGAAEEAMKKLAEEQKIKFVIGGLCSSATFGAASYAKGKEILLVSAFTSNQKLSEAGPGVFSLSYTDELLPEAIVQELMTYGKVATLSEKADDSTALEKSVDDLIFSKYKDKLVLAADEKFDRESTDFSEQLKKIRSSGAKALWLDPSSSTSALALLQALNNTDLKIKLIGQFAYNTPEIAAKVPALINEMLIIDYPRVKDPEFAKYRKQIITEMGPLNDMNVYYTAATVDALDVLVKLISENGGDFNSVQKALSTGTFSGHIGKIYFGGKAFLQDLKPLRLEVKEGQMTEI
jgi:branched-chain amino acid transport system substrate-binding protein